MFDALRKFAARSLDNIADLVEAAQVPLTLIQHVKGPVPNQYKAQRQAYAIFNRDQVNRANAIRAFAARVFP